MSMNELFGTTAATTVNSRALPGTVELNNLAGTIAHNIIKYMEADIDTYRSRITASASNSTDLEKLLDDLMPTDYDAGFLAALDEKNIDSILKSQQSKRSRAKSKAMTVDNYASLLTAAVAERILRVTTGRNKVSERGRVAGSIDYTIEKLEALAADQETLRKEIRNVQSKKSIMKAKEGFSEEDPRWQALCKVEQQLKDLRVGGYSSPQTVYVDATKQALADMFDGVDISNLKSAEAHDMLEAIKGLLDGPVITDGVTDTTEE